MEGFIEEVIFHNEEMRRENSRAEWPGQANARR